MTLLSVPVIDLSPYLEGSPAGKRQVADEVARACRDIGFLNIVGHGVPASLVEDCYAVSKAFFDLPFEEKMKVRRPRPDIIRGYSALGGEGLSYSLDEATPPDLKESMDIGPVDVPADDPYFASEAAAVYFAPNIWPERPAEMARIWTQYFRAMNHLSEQLMRIFALALDLPEGFFDDKIDKSINIFRALNYPDQPETPLKGQLRAGAHADYGGLTLVRQDDAPGGLEVRNKAGDWVGVRPVEGAFVLNIGDLVMRWTNDKWISTMHRVVNPPRDKATGSRRISLVFFQTPNYDAMVDCLDSCRDPDQGAKYPPITAGDHLISKFVKQTTFGEGVA